MAGPPRKPAGPENVTDSTSWGSRRPPRAPSEQLWGNNRFQADVLKPTCHFDFSPLADSLLSPLETGSKLWVEEGAREAVECVGVSQGHLLGERVGAGTQCVTRSPA